MSRTGFALLALAVAVAWFLWPSRAAHAGVPEAVCGVVPIHA